MNSSIACSVSISGAGRIKKWLKNTITTGSSVTTAPIVLTASATISVADAKVQVKGARTVSLVTPVGSLAMAPVFIGSDEFKLTSASAAALVGKGTRGNWSFSVTGNPTILSAFVDFQFTNGVADSTGPDGEYTLEYLAQGSHTITMQFGEGLSQSRTINLSSHQTSVNFAVSPVGVSVMDPIAKKVDVHEPVTYSLTYTITDGRRWRRLVKRKIHTLVISSEIVARFHPPTSSSISIF